MKRTSGIPTGNAGEYFVMGELLRQGLDAQLATAVQQRYRKGNFRRAISRSCYSRAYEFNIIFATCWRKRAASSLDTPASFSGFP